MVSDDIGLSNVNEVEQHAIRSKTREALEKQLQLLMFHKF